MYTISSISSLSRIRSNLYSKSALTYDGHQYGFHCQFNSFHTSKSRFLISQNVSFQKLRLCCHRSCLVRAHCRRWFEEALGLIPKSAQNDRAHTLWWSRSKRLQGVINLKALPAKESLAQRHVVIKPLGTLSLHIKTKAARSIVQAENRRRFSFALNPEKHLRAFPTDGEVPMDNNASERAIRDFRISNKNRAMIDTIHGARTSSVIYSIEETAKVNRLRPCNYFEYLLEEIPKYMERTDRPLLGCLVPWSTIFLDQIRNHKNESMSLLRWLYFYPSMGYEAFTFSLNEKYRRKFRVKKSRKLSFVYLRSFSLWAYLSLKFD